MTRIACIVRLPWIALGLAALASPIEAQNGLFEVQAPDATRLLQLNDDAGFVVRGEHFTGTIPATGPGIRLMWYPGKAALRAGVADEDLWDDENVGNLSVALGSSGLAKGEVSTALGAHTIASGDHSTALGSGSAATAPYSTALGLVTVASGESSTAMGDHTAAQGRASTAMGISTNAMGDYSTALNAQTKAFGSGSLATGVNTMASGLASTAMGNETRAAGLGSVAMGTGVTAAGDGSFVFGDRSTQYPMNALANQFQVRAFGGVLMNTGVDIGCYLGANEGSWTCTSSRLAKEGFEAVDGEEVLSKLAAMPIQRWRYLGSHAEHVGPVAEDFHAAFGLGGGTTGIATVDADGIALRAIQALERRTTELQKENAELRLRLQALESR